MSVAFGTETGKQRSRCAVIAGSPGLLAAHIAVRLRLRRQRVGVLAPRRDFLNFQTLLEAVGDSEAAPCAVEHIAPGSVARGGWTDAWYFLASNGEPRAPILSNLRDCGAEELNLVRTPFSGGGRWRWLLPEDALGAGQADPGAFGFRVVRPFGTTLALGDAPMDDSAQEGVLHALAVLSDLKAEIEARAEDFFDFRALRCAIRPAALTRPVQVESAAEAIIAVTESGAGSGCFVVGQSAIAATDLLDSLGAGLGLSLLDADPDSPKGAWTALDRALQIRLMGFEDHFDDTAGVAVVAVGPPVGPDLLEDLAAGYAERRQTIAAAERAQRTAASRKARRASAEIDYTCFGAGDDATVLINALGQGQLPLRRLIDELARHQRVITWDQRGLEDDGDELTLPDHVADLAAIVEAEQLDTVCLVAWCTGPKIAAEFAARHPGCVRSLVFLNPTLKCDGSDPEFDTTYERNFEAICHALKERPEMACSMMNSLKSVTPPDDELDFDDVGGADFSETILAKINRDLQEAVLLPFRSTSTLLRYSRQLIDFWKYDIRDAVARTDAPLLIVTSEHDQVAHPASAQAAASGFDTAQIVRVAGATHYFLYDRADALARLIDWFSANPPQAAAEPPQQQQQQWEVAALTTSDPAKTSAEQYTGGKADAV